MPGCTVQGTYCKGADHETAALVSRRGDVIAPVVRAQTTIVADVRGAIAKNDLKGGDELLAKFRQANGTSPEALEALSWLGRGALAAGDNERAAKYRRILASSWWRCCRAIHSRKTLTCKRRSARRLKRKARRWSQPASARAA